MIDKLVIPRERWGRFYLLGSWGGNEELCCLGHLGRVCGVPDTKLQAVCSIATLGEGELNKYPSLLRAPKGLREEAERVNDDGNLFNAAREARLIELFAQAGVELSFTGEYCTDNAWVRWKARNTEHLTILDPCA